MERLRRALRGVDRAEQPALPVGEAMHPIALAAVIVLLVNDWVLKALMPGPITGKLSDVAGLAFAPVALTAAIGLVLTVAARLGAAVDPSLSHRRLVASVVATGACFAAIKLSPGAAELAEHVLSAFGRRASIALDRTDLLALPALVVSYWLGRAAGPALADVRHAGGEVDELAAAIDAWDVARVDRLLRSSAA
jgi:hypothetical protein